MTDEGENNVKIIKIYPSSAPICEANFLTKKAYRVVGQSPMVLIFLEVEKWISMI